MAKKKGPSNKEEEVAVLEYLTKANRPYSATDIFNNLHAKYTKGSIAKALDKLMEDELVFGKVYGKTTIYSIKQATQDTNTTEDMDTVDKKVSDLSEQLETVITENKKLDQELSTLKNDPTTSEATALLENLKKENELLAGRLDELKNGAELIPPEKRKRVNDEYDRNKSMWKKRRAMFRDIFGAITEHMPGNPNDLKEKLGIEEDQVPLESI